MEFRGYRRPDGRVGTRNYVGVLSTVVCANEVAERIARAVRGAAAFLHHQGCGQMPTDVARVTRALVGLGQHPNLAAVLLVSLGCESVRVEMEGTETLPAAGRRLFAELLAFASGRLTKAEICGYTNSMDIYVLGPVI
jgi:altronate dehydratase large subunit